MGYTFHSKIILSKAKILAFYFPPLITVPPKSASLSLRTVRLLIDKPRSSRDSVIAEFEVTSSDSRIDPLCIYFRASENSNFIFG